METSLFEIRGMDDILTWRELDYVLDSAICRRCRHRSIFHEPITLQRPDGTTFTEIGLCHIPSCPC